MIVLMVFAFIAGLVTILSPCILPLLPIILASSISAEGKPSKRKPLGIVVGFVASFTFFTLFLTLLVKVLGVSPDSLRILAVLTFVGFGLVMIFPKWMEKLEAVWTKMLPQQGSNANKTGFSGGLLAGLSLGLLWTPCVGPILASVITLALTGTVTFSAVLITAAYAMGTAVPMFLIVYGGQRVTAKLDWFKKNGAKIQRVFGVLMIITAIAILMNADRKFQSWILDVLPGYGAGLTQLEENSLVDEALDRLDGQESRNSNTEMRNNDENSNDSNLKLPVLGVAPELQSEGEWFNSQPLTMEELRGKVVLIDFWTYSCINCQRTLPYLRDWWSKYENDGLVIIGVHAPEFEFEKDAGNVQEAIEDFELKYPVVQDNEFKTWRAYKNRYWPAKYLIDKDGQIRYQHFGEGKYEETEMAIQELLNEVGSVQERELVEDQQKAGHKKTPETYLGYRRLERFGSNEEVAEDEVRMYSISEVLGEDMVGYEGEWLVTEEYAEAEAGGKLRLNFEGKDVFLVMNPVGESGVVRVRLDGEVMGEVEVDSDSLYELVDLEEAGRHELELEFPEGGVEVYAFTFG